MTRTYGCRVVAQGWTGMVKQGRGALAACLHGGFADAVRPGYGKVTRSAGLVSSRQSVSRKARSTPGVNVERRVVS
jgi:hypothetical protein